MHFIAAFRSIFASVLLVVACAAHAQKGGPSALWLTHPDVSYREAGVDAYKRGKHEDAVKAFRESARFADKGAQAMLAELYWLGLGTERDRALAYIWADLAAERGYAVLVAKREAYWSELDAAERARVEDIGTQVYAEFGDAVAKPRLEQRLRRGARKGTGSRVGGPSNTVVHNDVQKTLGDSALEFHSSAESNVYTSRNWQPKQYWAAQDVAWSKVELPKGTVSVLPLREADAPAADATPAHDPSAP